MRPVAEQASCGIQRVQLAKPPCFFHQPVMYRPRARLGQPAGRVMHHIAFVVGDRYAKRHDQRTAFQFIVE